MTKMQELDGLVIVADSAKARFLHFVRQDHRLVEQPTLINPSAHLPQRDLTTDAPGRGFDHVDQARHTVQNDHTKDHAAQMLAKDVAAKINDASHENSVSKVVLIAPPRFLGQLRKFLSPGSKKLLTAEINKDLTHLSEDDILIEIGDQLLGRWAG